MGVSRGGIGVGGGGGLHFRAPVDVFANTTERADYFTATATANDYLQFVSDRSLAIVIGTLAAGTFWSYTGGAGAYDDSLWLQRTDAVQGFPGNDGDDGTDGAPGGGALELIGSFTATGSRTAEEAVDTGLNLGNQNSASFFGFRIGGTSLGSGIIWIPSSLFFSKTEAVAGSVLPAANRTTLPELMTGGQINGFLHAGRTVDNNLLVSTSIADEDFIVEVYRYVSAVNAASIVNVTGLGSPNVPASATTVSTFFFDAEIPRIWYTHIYSLPATTPQGTFNEFVHVNYLGEYNRDVRPNNAQLLTYLYDIGRHHFYRREFTSGGQFTPRLEWFQRTVEEIFGANTTWLGDAATESEVLDRVEGFDSSRQYLADIAGDVRELDNTSFQPQMYEPYYQYDSFNIDDFSVDRIQEIALALIAPYARADSPTGQIADAQIPDAIMRDAEFTAAAVRGLLNLTAQEVNDLLTGAAISGRVITFPQNDGTTATITVPPGGGTADGVVVSLGTGFSSDGQTLTLHVDDGSTNGIDISLNVPDALRASGITEARVQEIINATNLSALQGQVTDSQIPDEIMRDAELTATAIRNLLNLTTTEVNDLLTGASISGQVITFTQNDGTTETINVPVAMGGMADGVVQSGMFNSAGTELVLTLDTGVTVTIDVPAILMAVGLTADERAKLMGIAEGANRVIPYKLGNIYQASSGIPARPANNQGTATLGGITVAPAGWQLTRPEATQALPYVYDCHVYGYDINGVFGWQFGTPNRTDRYIGGGTPVPTVTDDIYFGTSDDDTPEPDELDIPAVNGVGTIPSYSGHRHHLIARLASESDITRVVYSDDPTMTNIIGAFSRYMNTVVPTGESLPFNVWVTNQALTNLADVEVTVS